MRVTVRTDMENVTIQQRLLIHNQQMENVHQLQSQIVVHKSYLASLGAVATKAGNKGSLEGADGVVGNGIKPQQGYSEECDEN